MKYKHEYMPMKAVGELFGTTSHKIGKWLIEVGLRTNDGKPSHRAYTECFIEQRFFNNCYTNYWQTEKTVLELVKVGHKLIPNPPEEYIEEYDQIKPPFTLYKNDQHGYDLLNFDGSIALTVYGEKNAKIMEKFLNILSSNQKFIDFFSKEAVT